MSAKSKKKGSRRRHNVWYRQNSCRSRDQSLLPHPPSPNQKECALLRSHENESIGLPCSFILVGPDEDSNSELKMACENIVDILNRAVGDPTIIPSNWGMLCVQELEKESPKLSEGKRIFIKALKLTTTGKENFAPGDQLTATKIQSIASAYEVCEIMLKIHHFAW